VVQNIHEVGDQIGLMSVLSFRIRRGIRPLDEFSQDSVGAPCKILCDIYVT